ncbi:MAG: hypothetical protein ACYDCK_04845, partial [Thermoplasmatota archaeon]
EEGPQRARAWRFAYLLPLALLVLAAYAAYVGAVTTFYAANSYCAVGQSCLDIGTYFWFEAVVALLLALLTRRGVRRFLKGEEMSAYRVAIPVTLGLLALVSLGAEVLSTLPSRGADVPFYYALWGEWDPGVTLFRIFVETTLAALLLLALGFSERGAKVA